MCPLVTFLWSHVFGKEERYPYCEKDDSLIYGQYFLFLRLFPTFYLTELNSNIQPDVSIKNSLKSLKARELFI